MRPIVFGSTYPENVFPNTLQIGRVRSNLRSLAVELVRVLEHEPNVCIQVLEARIRLLLNLAFDHREITRVLFGYHVPVARDVERDGVNGPVEYSCPRIRSNK